MDIDYTAGTFFGFLCSVVIAAMGWHMAESGCQTLNDVVDCEWSQSPFTPVAPDKTP